MRKLNQQFGGSDTTQVAVVAITMKWVEVLTERFS